MKRVGYYVAHMKAPHYGGDSGDIGGMFKSEDEARRFAREHVKGTPLGIYRVHSRGARRDLVTTVYPQETKAAASSHARKKSPAQLDREIAAALHGSSGEQSDVMIVTNLKDWNLLEESLALDAESAAFDRTLREQIGEALDAVEVGTTQQGRKVVARARAKDWELLRETLRVDALSKRLPKHEREDLQAALNRLVIKPWPH